jgi:hypothetical protein
VGAPGHNPGSEREAPSNTASEIPQGGDITTGATFTTTDLIGTAGSVTGMGTSDTNVSTGFPFTTGRQSWAPVVAAVNGICQGGGLLIAMLSDVAVASERATFRAPEVLRGISDMGYVPYLPPQVGIAMARDLLFTGSIRCAAKRPGRACASSRRSARRAGCPRRSGPGVCERVSPGLIPAISHDPRGVAGPAAGGKRPV